ncbi:hypothetical protein P8452_72795 [Trifolium repens]|nr:hypothetical protein P8452_72795 [Trifolium repens]
MLGLGDLLTLDYCNDTNWLTKDSNSFCPLKLQPRRAIFEKTLSTGTCRAASGYISLDNFGWIVVFRTWKTPSQLRFLLLYCKSSTFWMAN